jgi:glyceraldehyde 3-phosphate dehydrogenase
MNKIRVGINGFGRIGRTVTRILANDPRFHIVGINDLHPVETMVHLLRYDSVHGRFDGTAAVDSGAMLINGHHAVYTSIDRMQDLPWQQLHADIVIEATGTVKTKAQAEQHLEAGAGKVILSAPPEDDSIKTIVLGVNEHLIERSDRVLSNASCTTNSAAPMIHLLEQLCDIEYCYITTVHSYTGDQRLHDAPHKDLRRGRAAAESIVPTTTGAAKALTRIFPQLNDCMGGCGIRVPVPDGSLTDITCTVRKPVDIGQINEAFRTAASGSMKGILEYTEDPIVSRDIIGNTHSCIFDAQLTSVIGDMVKVVGWYDNEMGYSNRLRDLMLLLTNLR